MIIADVTFYPIGESISVGKTIKAAIEQLKSANVKCYPNSMATVLEATTIDELFQSIKTAEKYIISIGFRRLETIIKIDHRVDLENTVERKMKAIA